MNARIAICGLVATLLGAAVPVLANGSPAGAEAGKMRLILVGDSTMATRNGYGDALCKRFVAELQCVNFARNGRSSGSYRAEGLWAQVMALLREAKPQDKVTTYVLIQFGHNDQPGKPGRSTDLVKEYPVNLARYVDEARSAGAIPVLVTPLTRRTFKDGVLVQDLKPWAEAVRKVAASSKTPLLDLNADSTAAVAAMGPVEADTFAMAPPPKLADPPKDKPLFDYTHLGEKGAVYFSRMVAREIKSVLPALAALMLSEKENP